jgi:ABC-type branched-subunit amino acid transport system ATPase component
MGISGAVAGLAGALFAAYSEFIEPNQFAFSVLVSVIVAIFIGGPGWMIGPVIGAIAVTELQAGTNGLGSLDEIVYAGALLIVLLAFRGGVVGLVRSLIDHLNRTSSRRRGSLPPVARKPAERPAAPAFAREGAARVRSDEPATLELVDLVVEFGGVLALDGASLRVRQGEIRGLIGPNGAGKTTVVNAATGVVKPQAGLVVLAGQSLRGLGPQQRSRLGVTRTFQHPQLIQGISILENVMLGFDRQAHASLAEAVLHAPRSRSDEKRFAKEAQELLALVGIDEFAGRPAGLVPFGVQRRAEIARAIATRPDFIFLDEAGAGLTDEEREVVSDAVRSCARMAGGPGWIVIEHNIDFVRSVCAEVTVLVRGKVLAEGVTSEVLADERVIDVYLGSEVDPAPQDHHG